MSLALAIDDGGYAIATHLTADFTGGDLIGSGDWRLHFERMVGSAEGAVWDLSEWAIDEADVNPDAWVWAELEWESLNRWVRGVEWSRGGEDPNGRPRIGEVTVTLGSSQEEAAEFSAACDPWLNYSNTRPGTIMRAGLTSATDTRADGWIPLWTARVESWPPAYEGARFSGYRSDMRVDVTLTETLMANTRINDNSASPAGAGDTVTDRVDRLLTAAEWQYGLETLFGSGGESAITLQATDMAANRITELYLTADSTNSVVMSSRTGACLVTDWATNKTSTITEFSTPLFGIPLIVLSGITSDVGPTITLGYDPDSLVTANDADGIVNDHRYARVGGTQQTFDHPVSIGQFDRVTRARSDLICTTDGDALTLAEADNDREALTALRIENVDVVATGRPMALLAVAALEWSDSLWVFPPGPTANDAAFPPSGIGRIRGLTHRITPLSAGGVHWTASYSVDFYLFTSTPGLILPEA